MPFKQFVEQKMLKPCGMLHSLIDPTEQDPFIAKGYCSDLKQYKLTVPISGWTAVTLEDFNKWSEAIAKFQLISPSSTKEILMPVSPGKQAGLGGGSMEDGKLISHIQWNNVQSPGIVGKLPLRKVGPSLL